MRRLRPAPDSTRSSHAQLVYLTSLTPDAQDECVFQAVV